MMSDQISALSWLYTSKKESILILEPLSIMIRLATLAYYPKGTKLCIGNGYSIARPPGYVQSIQRWGLGETRANLISMRAPLSVAIDVLDMHPHRSLRDTLLSLAHRGLLKLNECYKRDPDVNRILLGMIRLIQARLLPDTDVACSPPSQQEKDYPKVIDADFVLSFWKSDQLRFVADQFEAIQNLDETFEKEHKHKITISILGTVDVVLESKAEDFAEKLRKNFRIMI